MRPFYCPNLRLLVGAFTLCLLAGGSLFAQEKVNSDQRLPPGVLFYASTPDVPASVRAFEKTSYGQLVMGPEMAPFRNQLIEKYQAEGQGIVEQIENTLDTPLGDLLGLIAGDASIAIVRPIGQPLAVVAFLEIGAQAETLQHLLGMLESLIAEQTPLEKQSDQYGEIAFQYYSIETEHPDYPAIDICYLVHDGQFVLTSSRSALEAVLDRWDGKHPQTFAGDTFYAKIMQECATTDGSIPDSIYYLNPIGLTTAGLELIPQVKPFVNLIPLYLPTLGLNRLRATGATVEIDGGEFNIVSRSMIYVDRPASGILKFFELRPTVTQPAAWVPADASMYFAFDWNVAGAYEAVEAVYDGFLGPGAFDRQISELSRQANQDNIHPKKDLVDVISGQLEGYYRQTITIQGDVPSVSMFFGVKFGVHDEDKAWKLVDALSKSGPPMEEVTVEGTRMLLSEAPDGSEVALTVKNGGIFLASGRERLAQILANQAGGPALADDAEYKRNRAHAPEQLSLLTYQASVSQFRDVYEKLRDGEFDAAVEGELDFSLLPPFESIQKYLVPTLGYMVPVEKGALSVQFGLKPAE